MERVQCRKAPSIFEMKITLSLSLNLLVGAIVLAMIAFCAPPFFKDEPNYLSMVFVLWAIVFVGAAATAAFFDK